MSWVPRTTEKPRRVCRGVEEDVCLYGGEVAANGPALEIGVVSTALIIFKGGIVDADYVE